MIKKQDLIAYFWEEGNMITTEEGVELAMHGDSVIEVSVMLRNALEWRYTGLLEPMVQLHAEFEDFKEFQRVMKIVELGDLNKVSLSDMMVLYADGRATLYKAEF